ncbi:uncharacterized protein [Linepithema humile]|uniref:uncharacterized protein n=1 Tax=Linepithema humile TaxID=83485 RepID=UPI00351EE1D6
MSTLSPVIKIGLHIFGVWPYLPSTILFRSYWIVMLSTAQVFQYRYVLVNIGMDDFSQFMDGVSSAMASSLLYIKLVILWVNQRIFFDLLQIMDADWRDYTSNGSRIMKSSADLAHRASRWIVGLQIGSVTFYSLGVLAANVNDPGKIEPYTRELILKMALPFNISTEAIYIAVQSVQFYHLFLVGLGITIVNSLLVTLILHIGGQIDLLREWLTKAFSRNATHSMDGITIESIILKHQKIILFAENIENLYTYISMMMLLSDTLIICCLGFIIVTSIGEPNGAAIMVKSLLFYITMNLEAFIYCFCGEYLSAKSEMIGHAAYDSLWYDFPAKEGRIMLLVIVRSQKRLKITSGKVVDLSLERFTSVVKASASYISVLLAMQSCTPRLMACCIFKADTTVGNSTREGGTAARYFSGGEAAIVNPRGVCTLSFSGNMETSTVSRAVKIGLHACGVWPYLPSTVFYRLFWILMLSAPQILQYQYLAIHYQGDDFSDFMDGVSSAMAYSLLFIKLTILWVNQRTFSDILQMMALDWKNCVLTDHSLRITTNKAKLSRRFSNWIIGLQLTAIVLYSCGVLAVNAGEIPRMNVSAREHILKMKLPFKVNTSPIYVAVTILQFFHLVMCGCGISIVNSLIVTLILHIDGQIDILCDWLLKVFSENVRPTDSVTIRTLITKHQRIIMFSENIENLYTYITLILFVSDTLIICCLGFIIVTSIGTPDGPPILVRSALFYVVMNLETFIYCFAGEYLSAKSKMIGDAAYDSFWYDVTLKKNRIVLLVILRSQKRLSITIGKIMDLSLERFTSVRFHFLRSFYTFSLHNINFKLNPTNHQNFNQC